MSVKPEYHPFKKYPFDPKEGTKNHYKGPDATNTDHSHDDKVTEHDKDKVVTPNKNKEYFPTKNKEYLSIKDKEASSNIEDSYNLE